MRIVHRSRPALIAIALCCAAAPAAAQGQAPGAPGPDSADGGAPQAPADDAVNKAREHFNRGVELFKEGNFQAALIEFRRANEVSPNYRILFNLGQTYFELQDYAGAMKSFDAYLLQGGAEIPAARRAEVEQELGKLRSRVARATITTNVAGAEILVDDSVVGKSPLSEPLLLSAGKRKLAISTGRGTPTVKFVELAGGDAVTVELLVETAAAAPAPVAAPVQPTQTTATPRDTARSAW